MDKFKVKEEEYNKKINILQSDLNRYKTIVANIKSSDKKEEEIKVFSQPDEMNFDIKDAVWDPYTPYAMKFIIKGKRAELGVSEESYQLTSFPK